jgi:hypothetical protein
VPDLETLRHVYADLVTERNRLRDARRGVTAQLGPLPASAGVIIGLFAAFGRIHGGVHAVLFGLALLPFAVAVVVSTLALRKDPYRRFERLREDADLLPEEEWLRLAIARERTIYPKLEVIFDNERRSLLWVQLLLATEVIYLVLITALRPYLD